MKISRKIYFFCFGLSFLLLSFPVFFAVAEQGKLSSAQESIPPKGQASIRIDGKPDVDVVPSCPPAKKGTTIVSKRTIQAGEKVQTKQCVSPENQFMANELSFGDFHLENNAWNGHRSTWTWEQCIEIRKQEDGSYLPRWDYDWGNEDNYQPGFYEWIEKSFPRIVSGVSIRQNSRSRDYMTSDYFREQCRKSGLPSIVKDLPQIKIDFAYSSSRTKARKGDVYIDGRSVDIFGDERNAVFISLFYPSCSEVVKPDPERGIILLVWTEKGPERRPTGSSSSGIFTDSKGRQFDIFTKIDHGDETYLALVPKEDIKSGTIVWNEFIEFFETQQFRDLGLLKYSEDWCLANIMFGTELWWGQGSFQVDKFQITRTY